MPDLGMWKIVEAYRGLWRIIHLCKCHGTVHQGAYNSNILRCEYCKEDCPQEVLDIGLLAPRLELPVCGGVDD